MNPIPGLKQSLVSSGSVRIGECHWHLHYCRLKLNIDCSDKPGITLWYCLYFWLWYHQASLQELHNTTCWLSSQYIDHPAYLIILCCCVVRCNDQCVTYMHCPSKPLSGIMTQCNTSGDINNQRQALIVLSINHLASIPDYKGFQNQFERMYVLKYNNKKQYPKLHFNDILEYDSVISNTNKTWQFSVRDCITSKSYHLYLP